MRFLLINPAWSFAGRICFGCRQPHLPLEFGYAKALIERDGHEVQMVDAQLESLTAAATHDRVLWFRSDFTVITKARNYLFWRCGPPELRIPQMAVQAVREAGGVIVAIGSHGSTTPPEQNPRSLVQRETPGVAHD